MSYNRSMKKKVLILAVFSMFTVMSFSLDTSLTYFNSLVYGNTILSGDAAWDHMDQINMNTGLVFIRPLEEKPRYGSRIRLAFDQPLWARIRQLDGEDNLIQAPGDGLSYGINLFAGLEIPLEGAGNLFQSSTVYLGPMLGYQSLKDSFLLTLGVEGGVDLCFDLVGNWSFVSGISARYYFGGLHTAGDATRYDVSVKRGWGAGLSPGIRYTY